MSILKKLLYIIIIIAVYQLLLFTYITLKFVHQHFIMNETNIIEKYGLNSYVIITGGSSG